MNEAIPQSDRRSAADHAQIEAAASAARSERSARTPAARMREVTISGLVQTVRRGMWLLLAVVALCVLVTAIALKLREPLYTATMIVAPAEADLTAATQLASEIEEFANLAALAQTPAKIERVSNLERYAQLFGSSALAARLQAEGGLLQIVFADQWDAERQAWHPPYGVAERLERTLLAFFGYPAWSEPNAARLAEWLGEQIDVNRLYASALLRVRMSYRDRQFALSVIEMAHHTANELLREEALRRVGDQIAAVESELGAAANPTRQQALEKILAAQYQTQALLRADQPYAAQIVVPAMASALPTSLNPLLVLVLAAAVGVMLGLFIVFLRDALRGGIP